MGQCDHFAEGVDADPLQACDHHVGLCGLQHLAVHPVLDHRQGRPLLLRRRSAQPLWRYYPRRNREALGALGQRVRAGACRGLRYCHQDGLKRCAGPAADHPDAMPERSGLFFALAKIGFAAIIWMAAAGTSWPQAASSPPVSQPAPAATPDQQAPPQGATANPPAAPEKSGLFNEMGKMFEKSLSILPGLKSPSETL